MTSITRDALLDRPTISSLTEIDRSAWVSWMSYLAGFLLAVSPQVAADVSRIGPGTMLMGGSIALFLVLVAAIQRHMRLSLMASSFGNPRRLVTGGVFAYSRNPIYVAFLLPLASIGYFSLAAAAAAIALYLVAMTRLVIAREESHLLATFGAEYARYLETTPRWIGL